MQAATRIPLRLASRLCAASPSTSSARLIHSSAKTSANVANIVGTGPPPEPPTPERVNLDARVARRRKQAEMLKTAKDIRSAKKTASANKAAPLQTRFWKDVGVHEVDGTHLPSPFLQSSPKANMIL